MRSPRNGLILLAMLLFAAGCNNGQEGKVDAKIADGPVKSVALVEAERPERRDISEYLAETGRISAESQVEVLAKGTGHCLSLKVEEGDEVRKGQVLAELDRAEMEAQVRQSRVNVAQQKLAYERAERGVAQGIVAMAERDNAKSAFKQAEASLDMQEVQLSHLTIRAPITGVVTKRTLQQGMLVSSGTAAFTIIDPSSFVLPINVNERHLPRLRVGQMAYVTIDSAGDRDFVAKVRRINPGVDLQSSAVKVILDFERKDHKYLREAAFARYQLVMDTREDTLAVPMDAIIEDNTRRYVMLVKERIDPVLEDGEDADTEETAGEDDGREGEEGEADDDQAETVADQEPVWVATRMEVEVGLEDSDYVEILSGVGADDMVITLGQQSVNDGDPVEVMSVAQALESKSELSSDGALEEAKKKSSTGSGAGRRQAKGRSGL
jgi:membrane fusion protein, multidrug efflux system